MNGLRSYLTAGVLITCVLITGGAYAAPEVHVSASVDKADVKIGQHITYKITVESPRGTEVEFPALEGSVGGLEIRETIPVGKSRFGRKTSEETLILSTFEPGPYKIPELTVKYRGPGDAEWREARTDAIPITVMSVLQGEKGVLDVKDIKGPVDIRKRLPKGLIWLLVLILAGLAGWAVYGLIKKNILRPEPPKPPHIIAYEALDYLRHSSLLLDGKIKEYFIELSDIVRRYVEGRFRLRAPEMTTEEFLVIARDNNELSTGHKGLLKDFMSKSDLVKFAKYGPTEKEIDEAFGSAKRLVDQTKQEEKKDR
jgi:hypothetical protein